jgi:photosystem II stability/assembly factor-like uncharacterized protein
LKLAGNNQLKSRLEMKFHGVIAIAFFCLLMASRSASGQTWMQTSATSNYWTGIACSADGTKLAALGGSKACYTSTNSGNTWVSNSFPVSINNSLITASADGNHMVAATSNIGEIDVSTNGGLLWNKSTNYAEASWESLVSSADGKKLVLTEGDAVVHASTNSGTSWYRLISVPNNGSDPAYAAMSADGNSVAIAVLGDVITTMNFGGTWVTNSVPVPLREMAASADGQKLITAPYGGNIYTSTDFGVHWTRQFNSPNLLWWSCASSADGTRLAAVSGFAGGSGMIYTSSDGGSTWISNSVPVQQWNKVISSADGKTLFATVNGNDPVVAGGIWALQAAPSPALNLSAGNGNVNLAWTVPSANFVLQQSPDLGGSSWTTLTNWPVLNPNNLQEQVTLTPANSSGFFRLTTQ